MGTEDTTPPEPRPIYVADSEKNQMACAILMRIGMRLLETSKFILEAVADIESKRRDYTAHTKESVAAELRRRGAELARTAESLP